MENYNEDRDEGYLLDVDVEDPEKTLDLHNDLSFSPKRIKFEKMKNCSYLP